MMSEEFLDFSANNSFGIVSGVAGIKMQIGILLHFFLNGRSSSWL